jgi:hypothetical protein
MDGASNKTVCSYTAKKKKGVCSLYQEYFVILYHFVLCYNTQIKEATAIQVSAVRKTEASSSSAWGLAQIETGQLEICTSASFSSGQGQGQEDTPFKPLPFLSKLWTN